MVRLKTPNGGPTISQSSAERRRPAGPRRRVPDELPETARMKRLPSLAMPRLTLRGFVDSDAEIRAQLGIEFEEAGG